MYPETARGEIVHFLASRESDPYRISYTCIASTGRGTNNHVFSSRSDKNSDCSGNLKLPLTYNWKTENWNLLLSLCSYFDKSFTEMFLE